MYLSYFKKFINYFIENKNELKKYYFLSFLVGIVEFCGVALIYPFIYKLVDTNGTIAPQNFILGGIIIILFIAKNLFMIYYTSLQADYSLRCSVNMSKMFMKYFLYGKYSDISKTPYAEKTQIFNYIIPNCINNFLLRILNLTVNMFIFILITAFLFIKFSMATLITTVFAFLIIYLQTKFFKSKVKSLSAKSNKLNISLNQLLNNTLLNSKSVKIYNAEEQVCEKYKKLQASLFQTNKQTLFYNIITPYITEPLIIILLLILLSIISIQNIDQPASLMASYALIASSIFRLAPTINRIQINITGINTALPLIQEAFNYYEKFDIKNLNSIDLSSNFVNFKDEIILKDINFSYNDKNILKNINFSIKKGEFIGIVGTSGVGKTTLIDIISGLLNANSGEIIIDGVNYGSNPPKLSIGYIQQELGIFSDSFKNNVAFGNSNIDEDKVIFALKKAKLYDFIIENYTDGINTNPFVDNTGLSLGQKQRLAIARALYNNPDIIILDEATSSLDLKTEDEICEDLNKLKGEKTIIAIAHRLSTINNADKIIFMNNSQIEAIGTFEELSKNNPNFNELVRLNSTNSIH